MMYNMGKVLVFLTLPLTPGRALCSPTRAARFPRTLPNSSPKCPTAPRATCRA